MLGSQIQRYLYREILSPTLLSLLVFTLVLLLGRLVRLVDLVINKGVSIVDILVLFGTMIPSFLSISLPMALLMGIMIGLSRMSADNETIALKAAGLSLTNIAAPIFSLAVIFALLTGIVALWIEPLGLRAFKSKVFEITRLKASIVFRPQVFMNQFDNLVFYADGLDDRSGLFRQLFIVEKREDGDTLVLADSGRISADTANESVAIHLADGAIHRLGGKDDNSYQIINFKNYEILPSLGATSPRGKRSRTKPGELSTPTLRDNIQRETNETKRYALNAELHRRLCTPLGPLLFALYALPFGIQPSRSGRSGGIVTGLVIYLFYYFLFSLADTLTAEGDISPWLSFWSVHLLMFFGGFYLLRRSSQEKPNPVAIGISNLLIKMRLRKI